MFLLTLTTQVVSPHSSQLQQKLNSAIIHRSPDSFTQIEYLTTEVDAPCLRKNRTGGRTSLSLLLQCLAQYDVGVAVIGRNHAHSHSETHLCNFPPSRERKLQVDQTVQTKPSKSSWVSDTLQPSGPSSSRCGANASSGASTTCKTFTPFSCPFSCPYSTCSSQAAIT